MFFACLLTVFGVPADTVAEVGRDVQRTGHPARGRVVTDTRGRGCHQGNFQSMPCTSILLNRMIFLGWVPLPTNQHIKTTMKLVDNYDL